MALSGALPGRRQGAPGHPIRRPGSLATIGPTYLADGQATGQLAVRVLKGESPPTTGDLLLSRTTAAALGVTLPETLLRDVPRVAG